MISRIKKFDITAGSKPNTAQYGSCVIFTTVENEKLYWDTTSKKIWEYTGKENAEFEISYKVINDYDNKTKEISHVRFR